MSSEERLQQAIDKGKAIAVIYHGGSQSESVHEITPLSIKDGRLRARCHRSNTAKTFILEKIEIVDGAIKAEKSASGSSKPLGRKYKSLGELLNSQQTFLSGLGWHIESEENLLALYSSQDDGDSDQSPDLSIGLEEYIYDIVADIDDPAKGIFLGNEREKRRPWIVKGRGARTFGSIDKATEVFLKLAEEMAPSRPA